MRIVYQKVAGVDVHKKFVVVAILVLKLDGTWHQEQRRFGTMTADLLALLDWLVEQGVTHVAMESTGEYWKPVFNILEGSLEVILVNAQHLSKVPGRKTDQTDAEWIAELMQCGLLKASFIPPVGQRELRDLTRYRTTFVRERATLVNRVHKVLESANIKLASVATDVMGVSGRAILAALIEGQARPEEMAELARGRLRNKRDQLARALEGRVKPHHQFVLTELLSQIDDLDEAIERFHAQITEYAHPFDAAVALVDTIPGIGLEAAQIIVSEIGADMSRFPTAAHLAAWAGVAPGNNQSGGKRRRSPTLKGNKALGAILNQVAQAAVKQKDTYMAAQYQRLVRRIGKNKAIVAVAHSILVMIYHMLKRQQPYQELGANYFDEHDKAKTSKRLVERLERMGFQVKLEPATAEAAA